MVVVLGMGKMALKNELWSQPRKSGWGLQWLMKGKGNEREFRYGEENWEMEEDDDIQIQVWVGLQ